MPPRKRILIVYYSLGGNTERVARDLAAHLGADLQPIHELTNRRGFRGYIRAAFDSLRERPALLGDIARNAADYDLTIVGTPIWVGRITPPVRTYLGTIRGAVRNVAFFTTSGGTAPENVVPGMERLLNLHAIASTGLAQRELRDPACYQNKLTAFLAAVRASAVPADRELVLARA
jgi:flavodoxin